MPNYTPAQTAKSWVALIGSAISVTVFGLQQSMQFLPPNWALTANAVLGVLTAIAVFLVPNAPATKAANAPANGPHSPWPDTGLMPEPHTSEQLQAGERPSGPVGP
jgi:hypothetical protein